MKKFLTLLAAGFALAIATAPSALATGGCEDMEAGCPNDGVADSALYVAERQPGGVHVKGWAIDPNTVGPIDAVIQIDGVEVATILADGPTPGSYHNRTHYGFDAVVPARPGSQVCVSPVMSGNGYGDCKALAVSTVPTGALESMTTDATTIRVRGWAIDPDSAAPIAVRFTTVDGDASHLAGQATAGLVRTDVRLAGHVAYGDAHGFEAALTRPSRWTSICAVAVNVGAGSDAPLGCRSIPPRVEIASVGLSPNLYVSSDDARPASTAAAADADVLLLATGRDSQSGVRSVGLAGQSIVTCVDGDGQATEHRRPLSATSSHPDPTATSGPGSRSVQHGFNVRGLLADCGAKAVWRSLRVELRARAQSFDNFDVTTSLVTIHQLVLKVATFNTRWSALPPVCGDPFQAGKGVLWTPWAWAKPCPDRTPEEPAMWFPHHDADETLRRWGRDLIARSDVALLTEVGSARQAALIAEGAGLPHVYAEDSTGYADVAILARFPLSGATRHWIPPAHSMIRDVTLDIGGMPHRFLATHWENDPSPNESNPDRVTSAQTLLDLVRGDEWRPIFFGGDLNAHRNQREVQLLTDAGLREACPVPAPDPDTCAMIDHVYSRGPYTATSYRHSFRAKGDPRDPTHPSDHPFVLVTYQRR